MSAAPSLRRHELLNPREHSHLRVRPPELFHRRFVPLVISEFAAAAARCPILLGKETINRRFYAGAIYGFKPGERIGNADKRGEQFTPLNVECEGFFIFRDRIFIDRRNNRFSETDGEPLFDDAFRPSSRLKKVQRALGQLRAGKHPTRHFIRTMRELKLVEPIDISLSVGGEMLEFPGLYAISADSLRAIDNAAALRLYKSGHLQFAREMCASLSKIASLAELRNQRLPTDR